MNFTLQIIYENLLWRKIWGTNSTCCLYSTAHHNAPLEIAMTSASMSTAHVQNISCLNVRMCSLTVNNVLVNRLGTFYWRDTLLGGASLFWMISAVRCWNVLVLCLDRNSERRRVHLLNEISCSIVECVIYQRTVFSWTKRKKILIGGTFYWAELLGYGWGLGKSTK